MKKKRVLAGTAAAIAAVTVFVPAAKKREKPVEVVTTAVAVGEIKETIQAGGRIFPTVEVDISAEVSGEIVRLECFDGKSVRKGDTLLVIKQEPYIAEVESAEASLGVLEAEHRQQKMRMEQAVATLARMRRLAAGGGIADSELQKAEADSAIAADALEAAFHSVRRGRALLRQAQENLALTTVLSPMNGTVTFIAVKKGERIVGTSQMSGTLIMKIADLSTMALKADISENDIASIHVGDSADISVEAFRDGKLKGVVTHIANSSKFIDGTFGQVANFEVRIGILPIESSAASNGGEMRLRPGMSASASISASRRGNILKIPAQSIFLKERKECVWVIGDDGRAHATFVRTGIQDLDSIEVSSGLKKGERVVSAPLSAISTVLTENRKTKEK